MKNTFLLSVVIVLLSGCTSRNTNSQFDGDFLLHAEFYPSLHSIPFRVIIQKERGETTLELDILCTRSKAEKYGIESLNPIPDSTFLINHNDWIFLRDSFYVDYKIKTKLRKEDFRVFGDSLGKIDLLGYQPAKRSMPMIDGISMYVKFSNSRGKNVFNSNSPTYYNEKDEYMIAESIFKLLERVVKDKNTARNIDVVSSYFGFGSKIVQVNNDPFELMIQSKHPSLKEENYIYYTLILPKDRPVIIDISNSGILSDAALKFLYTLIQGKYDLYWIVDDFTKVRLQRWNVPDDRIFLDRRLLEIRINKNNVP